MAPISFGFQVLLNVNADAPCTLNLNRTLLGDNGSLSRERCPTRGVVHTLSSPGASGDY